MAVIPRGATPGSDVGWIQGDPFFQFHAVNAHGDGNQTEVAFPWYDSFSFTSPSKKLVLHRLVIDTDKRTLTDGPLDARAGEFGTR
jgi:carotenoid cleavage dioxygenase-like enzyme